MDDVVALDDVADAGVAEVAELLLRVDFVEEAEDNNLVAAEGKVSE